MTHRKWLRHYRGAFKAKDGYSTVALAVFLCPEYGVADKLRFQRSMMNSLDHAWAGFQEVDFMQSVPWLDVPVYFFAGRHDYCVPSELVERWANVLHAPRVEVVWFENSAHNPCLEEPDRFQHELIERVLKQTTPNQTTV